MKKIKTLVIAFLVLAATSCSVKKSENTIQAKKNTIQVVKYKKNKESGNTGERQKKVLSIF